MSAKLLSNNHPSDIEMGLVLTKVKLQTNEVHGILAQNVNRAFDNQQQIAQLDVNAERLEEEAKRMKDKSSGLNQSMCRQKYKIMLIIIVILIIILACIGLYAYFSTQ
jgi:uncharacterized membrane protein (DUF106 family)